MLDRTNRSVLGFQVKEIIKAQVCYAGVVGKYPKAAKCAIKRILFWSGTEERVIEAAFADKRRDTWLLLDPIPFNYADGVDMMIYDDRLFSLWTPIEHSMGITGLYIAPDSLSHSEANVDTVDLALVHHELWKRYQECAKAGH